MHAREALVSREEGFERQPKLIGLRPVLAMASLPEPAKDLPAGIPSWSDAMRTYQIRMKDGTNWVVTKYVPLEDRLLVPFAGGVVEVSYAEIERVEQQYHDPYPDSQLGPSTGTRPLQYNEQRPLPVRIREKSDGTRLRGLDPALTPTPVSPSPGSQYPAVVPF